MCSIIGRLCKNYGEVRERSNGLISMSPTPSSGRKLVTLIMELTWVRIKYLPTKAVLLGDLQLQLEGLTIEAQW